MPRTPVARTFTPNKPKPLFPAYEGMEGLDTVYDAATDRSSTACLYGARGTRYTTGQNYSSAFGSKVPRPWEAPPEKSGLYGRVKPLTHVGPVDYQPYPASHLLSAGTSWQSRGRAGPMGLSFDGGRKSLSFCSSTPRTTNSTTKSPKVPTKTLKEDAFILKFDHDRRNAVRQDFAQTLNRRTIGSGAPYRPPAMPTRPPIGVNR